MVSEMMENRIKVLHIVLSLEPGGMENGVLNVASRINKNLVDVHICCLEKAGRLSRRFDNTENLYVLSKKPGFSVVTVFRLARLFRRLKPEVIHTHNLGPLIYSCLARLVAPFGVIVQGEHAELPNADLSFKRITQRRIFYFFCRFIHTVSGSLSDQLKRLKLSCSKIVTLLNGVDVEYYRPNEDVVAPRSEILGISGNIFNIGIVGRFGPFKHHGRLLDAFEKLADEDDRVHLTMIGGGGELEELIHTRVAASSHRERIHLTGFQQDMRRYYQLLDLLVIPSENEGMSNACLEAMACGVAVLSNNNCGCYEIIENDYSGFICDLGTVDQLYEALKRIRNVEKEQLGNIARKGRENVKKRFSIQRMVENYENLYQYAVA